MWENFIWKIFSKISGRENFGNFSDKKSKIRKIDFWWKMFDFRILKIFDFVSEIFQKFCRPKVFENIFQTEFSHIKKLFKIPRFFLFEPSWKIVAPYVSLIPRTSTHSSLYRITGNVTGNCSIPVYLVQS